MALSPGSGSPKYHFVSDLIFFVFIGKTDSGGHFFLTNSLKILIEGL